MATSNFPWVIGQPHAVITRCRQEKEALGIVEASNHHAKRGPNELPLPRCLHTIGVNSGVCTFLQAKDLPAGRRRGEE